MTIRDFSGQIAAAHSLAPAVRTASATGTAVDLRGYDGATVLFHFGAYSDGSHTPELEASADGASYSAVPASQLSTAFAAVAAAGGANSVQAVGYRGPGRYLRAVLTVAGATSGAASAAQILRGDGARQGV